MWLNLRLLDQSNGKMANTAAKRHLIHPIVTQIERFFSSGQMRQVRLSLNSWNNQGSWG
jgi:hypothetical protein